MHLFPNPVSNNLTIQHKGEIKRIETLMVVDITGRKIMEQTNISLPHSFNFSSLNKGLYILIFNNISSYKFIKD
ncbi:MAG: T9SS type A sorting domain-containing protein [Flavobacteriales bacterium]|nr:T9SS type A sorting domain-containing protein [Flavobacteriales bacterium]